MRVDPNSLQGGKSDTGRVQCHADDITFTLRRDVTTWPAAPANRRWRRVRADGKSLKQIEERSAMWPEPSPQDLTAEPEL